MNRYLSFVLPALFVATTNGIPIIPTLPAPAGPTTGIAAFEDGTLYFVDSFNNTVWKVAPGREMTPHVTGRNGRSLTTDVAGNIYGMHTEASGRSVVWRADTEGNVIELDRSALPTPGGHAFVLDEHGHIIRWTGTSGRTGVRLWRTREHQRQLVAGGEWGLRDGAGAAARFFPIGAMALADDGNVLVTSGGTIRRVSADGSVSTICSDEPLLKGRSTFLSRLFGDVRGHLTGITVDDAGVIYVVNYERESVVRITGNTAEELPPSDEGWRPTGVTAANGAVYILEYGYGARVRRVTPDGVSTVVALARPVRGIAARLQLTGTDNS